VISVTHWGTSPKFLRTIKQENLHDCLDLKDLRYVLSAGSPLTADIYPWFYDFFPKSVGLFNGSGGTDVVSGSKITLPNILLHQSGDLLSSYVFANNARIRR
jgi:acyl-coenzyme A synthetase/AMP-(fatty) acid ligase